MIPRPLPEGDAMGDALSGCARHPKIGARHPLEPAKNLASYPPGLLTEGDADDAGGDATGEAKGDAMDDAVESLLTVSESVQLTGIAKQNLHKRLAKAGLLQDRLCESGPNKGRPMKVVLARDLFRLYPEALSRFEARRTTVATLQKAPEPSAVPTPPSDPEAVAGLKDWQRRRMDARIAVLHYLQSMQQELGLSKEQAMARLVADADAKRLPQEIQPLISLANVRSGQEGTRTLSRRTIQRWEKDLRKGLQHLAPRPMEFQEPRWARVLLDLYRQPQKPSLRYCVDLLPGVLPHGLTAPSYSAAMRWMAAAVKAFSGGIAVLDASGNCRPAITATGLTACGVFQETMDNLLGGAGAKYIRVEKGVFGFLTDGTINRTFIGKTVYLVDDQTVAATDGGGTRSPAGVLDDFDGNTAWIHFV